MVAAWAVVVAADIGCGTGRDATGVAAGTGLGAGFGLEVIFEG